jgi:hypothetical protein
MFLITSNPLHQKLLLAVVANGLFLDGSDESIATNILSRISELFGTALSAAVFPIGTAGKGIVAVLDLDPGLFLYGFHTPMTTGLILLVLTLVVSVLVQEKEDSFDTRTGMRRRESAYEF